MENFTEQKMDFQPYSCVAHYFGPRIAFYLAYLSFYTNWLIGPAMAGIIVFGLEFVPSEYASMVKNLPADDERFDDQYDHPMMFLYGFFLMLWLVFTIRGWYNKQTELSHRWKVMRPCLPAIYKSPPASFVLHWLPCAPPAGVEFWDEIT